MRFIAIASVSCASADNEPKLIAPVQKRFTISLAGSTSSIEIGLPAGLKSSRPRSWPTSRASLFTCSAKILYAPASPRRAATCSEKIACGSHAWRSPVLRQWNSPGFGSHAILSSGSRGNPSAWRRSVSCSSTAKLTPCRRLTVPPKQRSITSSASPTTSKICAPL